MRIGPAVPEGSSGRGTEISDPPEAAAPTVRPLGDWWFLLTAQRIAKLKNERDAPPTFRTELEKLALTLPPTIYSEATLEERLNDEVNSIFTKWQRDPAKYISSYARRLFGNGALTEPEKLAHELIKSAVKQEGAAGIVATAGTHGAHLGGLMLNIAAAAVVGWCNRLSSSSWGETVRR